MKWSSAKEEVGEQSKLSTSRGGDESSPFAG